MNNLRKKEKFSIRKFSVGIASILIGSSMLMTYPQVNLPTVQAKEKIEVEANTDISLTVRETNEETTIELLALKDLTNVDVKVTFDGVKVITYHIDSLKAGQKQERVISKAELQSIKNNIKNKKILPNTAVVRKDISKKFSITGGELGVGVSYDVEADTTEIKPEKPTKPNKPEKPAEPNKPEKPTEPSKPEIPVYETADGENVTLNEDKTRAVFGDNDNSTPVKVDTPTAALEKDVARLEVEKVDVPNVDNTNNDRTNYIRTNGIPVKHNIAISYPRCLTSKVRGLNNRNVKYFQIQYPQYAFEWCEERTRNTVRCCIDGLQYVL